MMRICLVSILIFASSIASEAQEQPPSRTGGAPPGLRRQALVMDINARVLTDEQEVSWYQSIQRVAMPGNPVIVRLVGSNVVVVAQFTPLIRRQGNVLVAQGQIWIETPGRGVSYYTSIQTIPMDFDEPLYFFPLGTNNSSIEIVLTVNPYTIASAENEN